MSHDVEHDLLEWQRHRPQLLGLAYRMLGDLARAEDIVQDTWLRWQGRGDDEIADARAYLAAIVARLCLNDLASARSRREHSRGDRLPEPVDIRDAGIDASEKLEELSMALMIALQRLTAAERAVLLLHDVFDFRHAEAAELVGKSESACRKLLERARASVAQQRRELAVAPQEHARMLAAFVRATAEGDVQSLVALLADDAVLVTDGGEDRPRISGIRALPVPLHGARQIAAFVCTATERAALDLVPEVRELNGQPAVVLLHDDRPFAVVMLAITDGRISRVWFYADRARIERLGRRAAEG